MKASDLMTGPGDANHIRQHVFVEDVELEIVQEKQAVFYG